MNFLYDRLKTSFLLLCVAFHWNVRLNAAAAREVRLQRKQQVLSLLQGMGLAKDVCGIVNAYDQDGWAQLSKTKVRSTTAELTPGFSSKEMIAISSPGCNMQVLDIASAKTLKSYDNLTKEAVQSAMMLPDRRLLCTFYRRDYMRVVSRGVDGELEVVQMPNNFFGGMRLLGCLDDQVLICGEKDFDFVRREERDVTVLSAESLELLDSMVMKGAIHSPVIANDKCFFKVRRESKNDDDLWRYDRATERFSRMKYPAGLIGSRRMLACGSRVATLDSSEVDGHVSRFFTLCDDVGDTLQGSTDCIDVTPLDLSNWDGENFVSMSEGLAYVESLKSGDCTLKIFNEKAELVEEFSLEEDSRLFKVSDNCIAALSRLGRNEDRERTLTVFGPECLLQQDSKEDN